MLLTLNVAVGWLGSSGTDGIDGNRLTRAKGLGVAPTPRGKPTGGTFSLHEPELIADMALSVPTVRVSTPISRSTDRRPSAEAVAEQSAGRAVTAAPTASARIQLLD